MDDKETLRRLKARLDAEVAREDDWLVRRNLREAAEHIWEAYVRLNNLEVLHYG